MHQEAQDFSDTHTRAALIFHRYSLNAKIDQLNINQAQQRLRTVLEQVSYDPLNNFFIQLCQRLGQQQSCLLVINNILPLDSAFVKSTQTELLQFLAPKAAKFGKVKCATFKTVSDDLEEIFSSHCGLSLFLEYEDEVAAVLAQAGLNGLQYQNRVISCAFYPLQLFRNGIYNLNMIY